MHTVWMNTRGKDWPGGAQAGSGNQQPAATAAGHRRYRRGGEGRLNGVLAGFTGADADDLLQRRYQHFPIAIFPVRQT